MTRNRTCLAALPARLAFAALIALTMGIGPTTALASDADQYGDARPEFVAAMAEAARAAPGAVATDSDALKEYPLYPYVLAARLQRRLADPAAVPDVQAFLERYGDQPVSRSLRREFLMALALRKQWDAYLTAYRPDVDDTIAARCNAFAARIALGRTEGMANDVVEQWSVPKSLPPACDPAFEWARAQGLITPELIEMRAKAALDAGQAGLARILARSLPESKAAPINQWAGLIEQPRSSVDALIANPSRSVDREALLDGWQRYARADPEAAADRYAALVQARGLDARSASPFAIAVGLRLALSRNARALEFFSLGHPDDFDEQAHEWHARAALWAGDWPRVRKAIEAMPDSLRGQNRWKYWAARSAEQAGDSSVAQQGYATSEPYAIEKAGIKPVVFLLADQGYPPYSEALIVTRDTLGKRGDALKRFVRASAEGWKSYLANPAPGNALIKRDNPEMSDELLAYSHRKMKEYAIVAGGDAGTLGLLTMTDARWTQTFDFLRAAGLARPGVDYRQAYTLAIVRDVKVLP